MGEVNDVAKVEEIQPDNKETALTPLSLIQQALSINADVDKLEKLMNLQERWERNQARKAFDESMTNFQMDMPIIKKTKEGGQTKSGQVAYKYAPLEDIVAQTKDIIAKNGFSYLIKTEFPEPNKVTAICQVRHKQGHMEESVITVPHMTQTGVMSDAQVVAATVTFAKRYAFCNAFGIMTGDDDTDSITSDIMSQLNDLLKDWKFKHEYINTVISQINSRKVMEEFIAELPTLEHTKLFLDLLSKIDETKHRQLWIDFQKQRKLTADKWLNSLSASKLIKKETL